MDRSSTTQRKKKTSAASIISTEETPKQPPSHLVATVRKRRCGTSPFDTYWLNLDCCGLFCAGFTYCLHLYGCYVVCMVLVPPWFSTGEKALRQMNYLGYLHCSFFATIAFLAVCAHFKAMTTDPGAVPPDAEPVPDPMSASLDNFSLQKPVSNSMQSSPLESKKDNQPSLTASGVAAAAVAGLGVVASSSMPTKPTERTGKRLCRRCKSFKPKRAHHCSICRRCVVKMDHHCPWVNNCVGIGNHKFFLLFVLYTSLSCLYSFSLLVWRFSTCTFGHSKAHCLDNPQQLLHLAGLTVESMLFGLFTCCMMVDQWGVVTTNVTNIDRLKGFDDFVVPSSNPLLPAAINEVFGGKYSFEWKWLSPFSAVSFPISIRDEVMGFCIPCTGLNSRVQRVTSMKAVAEIV